MGLGGNICKVLILYKLLLRIEQVYSIKYMTLYSLFVYSMLFYTNIIGIRGGTCRVILMRQHDKLINILQVQKGEVEGKCWGCFIITLASSVRFSNNIVIIYS